MQTLVLTLSSLLLNFVLFWLLLRKNQKSQPSEVADEAKTKTDDELARDIDKLLSGKSD